LLGVFAEGTKDHDRMGFGFLDLLNPVTGTGEGISQSKGDYRFVRQPVEIGPENVLDVIVVEIRRGVVGSGLNLLS